MNNMQTFALAWRQARRELRGGLVGFRIFFMCVALGTAAIAGVGSLSGAFLSGLRDQGQTLLGGDVAVELRQPANAKEMAFFAAHGRVSASASMQAMAFALKEGRQDQRQLVNIKAVDKAWPLFGAPKYSNPLKGADAVACEDDGICGAAAEQSLLDRLKIRRGDLMRVGDATLRLITVLESEPDRISAGFSLGPHVLVSEAALAKMNLVQPGSLVEYTYRVAFKPGSSTSIESFKADADKAFHDDGWRIRDRNDAAPGIRRFVEQVTMFLTLVGLTAMGVGGVGASEAVSAFLDRKRFDIAILKSLGADGREVFLICFLQVMAITIGALLLGLIVGATAPYGLAYFYADVLPLPPTLGIYPGALALAAGFGLLAAIAFSVPPLGRAREIPPASLLRENVEPPTKRPPLPYLLTAAAAAAGIAILMLLFSPSPLYAGELLLGAVVLLGLLRGVSQGIGWLLARMPRPKSPLARLALGDLTRPGAATGGVITALGLGLTLLATVSLLDRSITNEVSQSLPGRAPSFFFVDIQKDQADAFDRTIHGFKHASDYKRAAMLRGRISALNGVPVVKANIDKDARWAFNGDRGITYAAKPPEGTQITAGKWWDAGYHGDTLISLDESIAEGAKLKLGDHMTLNVLGRDIEGRIASLRKVDFGRGGQNFVLILSPGVIDQAPHSFLATVRVPPEEENAMFVAVTDKYPNISTVRVKDAIAQVDTLLQQLATGIRAASLVTILAGLLVLAGTIAAGARTRLYDATILKVVGATRWQIAAVYILEYGFLGVSTGIIALAAGSLAASLIAGNLLKVPFVFDSGAAFLTIAGGGAATLLFGLFGALAAMGARPAARLRSA